MALSQKSMEIGIIYLGTWIYDCSQLKSVVKLSSKRPNVSIEMSFGKDVGDAVAAGMSFFPGEFAKKAGKLIKNNFPQIEGKIFISIEAEATTNICKNESGESFQSVGWYAFLQVTVEGLIKTPAITIKGKAVALLKFDGDEVKCECNQELSHADKLNVQEREKVVMILPEKNDEACFEVLGNLNTKTEKFQQIINDTMEELNSLANTSNC